MRKLVHRNTCLVLVVMFVMMICTPVALGDGMHQAKTAASDLIIENGVVKGLKDTFQGGDLIIPEGVTQIDSRAFYDQDSLGPNVTIPESIRYIGDSAFMECDGLENLSAQDGLIRIGPYAFSKCSNLQRVDLPDSLRSIGDGAFLNCSKLKEISLAADLTTVSESSFYGCTSLTDVKLGNSLCWIKSYTFKDCPFDPWASDSTLPPELSASSDLIIENGIVKGLKDTFQGGDLIIPEGVTQIGTMAFYDQDDIGPNVTIPGSVKCIGLCAFMGCDGLENLNVQDGLILIGHSAFSSCSNLLRVDLPDSLKSIESYAFEGCSKLKEISLTADLTTVVLSFSPFEGCTSLTDVKLGNNLGWIESDTFKDCPFDPWASDSTPPPELSASSDLIIENGVVKGLKNSFQGGDLIIPEGVTQIDSLAFHDQDSIGPNVSIPGSVRYIGTGAFRECDGLENLNVQDGLIRIESGAFLKCSNLQRVDLPNSLRFIGYRAFDDCSKLKEISLTADLTTVSYIPFDGRISSPFDGCVFLTDVKLGDNLGWINEDTFKDCPFDPWAPKTSSGADNSDPEYMSGSLVFSQSEYIKGSKKRIDVVAELTEPEAFSNRRDEVAYRFGCLQNGNFTAFDGWGGTSHGTSFNMTIYPEELDLLPAGEYDIVCRVTPPAADQGKWRETIIGRESGIKLKISEPLSVDPTQKPQPSSSTSAPAPISSATATVTVKPTISVNPTVVPQPSSSASAPAPISSVRPTVDPQPSGSASVNPDVEFQPTSRPVPPVSISEGYQSGWINKKNYYVKTSGFSTMYYLRSSSGRMARVSASSVKAANGTAYYPINNGGTVLFPRIENGNLTCFCVFQRNMEVPVLAVVNDACPQTTPDGYQTGTVNGKPYCVKTSGASTMFYLRSSSGRMARVSAPYVTAGNGTRYYPVNYGGVVLFPRLTNGQVTSYVTSNGESVLMTL